MANNKEFKIPRPDQIKKELDKHVIGQEEAKITLSVAAYNHYKRIEHSLLNDDVEIEKSNVILLGETGCGKTHLVQTLAKMLNVPFHIQDCTKITASGYVGSDVEECLVGLLRACDFDVARAEYGIVMLDEGDKIAKTTGENPSITRDVSGECVQQSLLKIVEGDIVGVQASGGRKHPMASCIHMDTTNILFILAGAFVGIDKIVSGRIGKGGNRIGFGAQAEKPVSKGDLYRKVTPPDLMSFGFIPELVGRFPVITYVEPLDVPALERILTEPKNALVRQFTSRLGQEGLKLDFDRDALHAVAEWASRSGTGARALRGVMERVLRDTMYSAPLLASKGQKTVRITEEFVVKKLMDGA